MDIVDELDAAGEECGAENMHAAQVMCDAMAEILTLRQQLLESERLRAHLGAQIAKLAQEAVDNFKPLMEEKAYLIEYAASLAK